MKSIGGGLKELFLPSFCECGEPAFCFGMCRVCFLELQAGPPGVQTEEFFHLFHYTPRSAKLIHDFKYRGIQSLAQEFMQAFCGELGAWAPFAPNSNSLLLPVPLHKKKLKIRGYNQAERLAYALEKAQFGQVKAKWLKRTHHNTSLTTMNRTQRENQTKNLYQYIGEASYRYENIVIVDDVYTTGATYRSVKEALQQAGFAKIYCFTVLQTPSACGQTDFHLEKTSALL
jgi:ComF family protein